MPGCRRCDASRRNLAEVFVGEGGVEPPAGLLRARLEARRENEVRSEEQRVLAQVGRPRLKGQRLPTLAAVAGDSTTVWTPITVPDWYGTGERGIEVVSDTAVWYHTGRPPVPLRWVLIRDPHGQFATQALLGTDRAVAPEQIVAWFVRRWQLEVTFEEARRHLGVETQRQWSERARSAPDSTRQAQTSP